MTTFRQLKFIVASFILTATLFAAQAQEKTKLIGNKPRSGKPNGNFNMARGSQIGIKMDAGLNTVQLLTLNFDADCIEKDGIRFKVNVYEFRDATPGRNLVRHPIYGVIPKGWGKVTVDLEPYSIKASGNILVSVEWLGNYSMDNHFAIGLLNGGTWVYEGIQWKKKPIGGADFNVQVRQLKKS